MARLKTVNMLVLAACGFVTYIVVKAWTRKRREEPLPDTGTTPQTSYYGSYYPAPQSPPGYTGSPSGEPPVSSFIGSPSGEPWFSIPK